MEDCAGSGERQEKQGTQVAAEKSRSATGSTRIGWPKDKRAELRNRCFQV